MKKANQILLILPLILSMLASLSSYSQRPPLTLFCPDTLENVNSDIRNDKYGKISGITIYHNSRIIYEKYYGFSQASTLHPISSVTKSITSIAVGVCIDSGIIPSLDVRIEDYFPEYSGIFEKDTLKKQITLRHLLAQTSGFAWDEWSIHYSYAGNPLIELSQIPQNWIPIILELPMDSSPGEKFNYNSSCSELVKEIISRTSGLSFQEFVEKNIFRKMNISPYHWDTYPQNQVPAWGGLSLTTRDMAKIGILMLNKGKWAQSRIISEEWVEQSTLPAAKNDSLEYGLLWWITKQPDGNPLVFAAGYGDQYVYIAPDKSLVVAINAKNFTDHKWDKDHKDLIQRILNAYVY